MSRHEDSLPPTYFDDLYAADPDPWRFASSPYERDKYGATLEALPRQHYDHALEIGCSIGVLTSALAPRCGAILALDVSATALEQAKMRCAGFPNVAFEKMQVPGAWPDGRYSLILLSEVVYYLDRGDVCRLAERVEAASLPDADIVLVHWLGETHYPLTGDEAADLFIASTKAVVVTARREEAYRLDVLRARPV